MTESEKKDKKKKLWEVDPSIFEPGPQESRWKRYLVEPAKSIARLSFFIALLAYPLTVILVGILFGGLIFWGFLGGSLGLIGLVLWKGGYAKNFESWDISMKTRLLGLSFGFLLALGFFLGLIFLGLWMIPVILALAALGVLVAVKTNRI